MKKCYCLLAIFGVFTAPFVGCGDSKKEKTEVKEKAEVKDKAEVKKETAEVKKEAAETK